MLPYGNILFWFKNCFTCLTAINHLASWTAFFLPYSSVLTLHGTKIHGIFFYVIIEHDHGIRIIPGKMNKKEKAFHVTWIFHSNTPTQQSLALRGNFWTCS